MHPTAVQQRQVEELIDPRDADKMSDLTMDEIRCIAAYRALDGILPGGLPNVTMLFDNYIKLKFSYDRLSRKELVSILRPGAHYYISGSSVRDPENAPDIQPQKKGKGLIDRFLRR